MTRPERAHFLQEEKGEMNGGSHIDLQDFRGNRPGHISAISIPTQPGIVHEDIHLTVFCFDATKNAFTLAFNGQIGRDDISLPSRATNLNSEMFEKLLPAGDQDDPETVESEIA